MFTAAYKLLGGYPAIRAVKCVAAWTPNWMPSLEVLVEVISV